MWLKLGRRMLSKILTISKFTIIESMRNRLLWLSLLVVAVSFGLVEFIGDLAITEHRVTQVAVLAAFLRLSSVVILAMFVVSSTVRELQDKTLEMILAMPIHRSSYYLGKLTGFIQVAVISILNNQCRYRHLFNKLTPTGCIKIHISAFFNSFSRTVDDKSR